MGETGLQLAHTKRQACSSTMISFRVPSMLEGLLAGSMGSRQVLQAWWSYIISPRPNQLALSILTEQTLLTHYQQ